jgi:hypothetical protein
MQEGRIGKVPGESHTHKLKREQENVAAIA